MRILFLSTWFPYPPDNGSKLRVYYLLRALAQAQDVTLVSFAFDTAWPDQPGDQRLLCSAVHAVPVNPFEVNRAGTLRTFLSARPIASRPIPAMMKLVTEVLHKGAFEAVIASTETMAHYALLSPPGIARILEEHNSMTRWMHERYDGANGTLQRARRWVSWKKRCSYEGHSYRHFDLITMVSELDRAATVMTVGDPRVRVEVVANGVDCVHNRPGLAQLQANALVYNGSLTYAGNYDAMRWFLAGIYPRVKSQAPDVRLTITGSTVGVDLAGLALDDTVRLTGFVDDVRTPVAEASVCVAPIRQGGGTRLKILEAMALGTAVVATPKAAEGLEVVDGEHLLLAVDAEQFASQTIALLRDADKRQRLATRARQLVESQYDWQQIGERFVAFVGEATRATRGQ